MPGLALVRGLSQPRCKSCFAPLRPGLSSENVSRRLFNRRVRAGVPSRTDSRLYGVNEDNGSLANAKFYAPRSFPLASDFA